MYIRPSESATGPSALSANARPPANVATTPETGSTPRPDAPHEGRLRAASIVGRLDRAARRALEGGRALESLQKLDAELDALSRLVTRSRAGEQDALAAFRDRLDAVTASIEALTPTGPRGQGEPGTAPLGYALNPGSDASPDGFTVLSPNPRIESFRIDADLAPGESRTLDARVIASAQHAALFLSFGETHLNLSSAIARFSLEFTGIDAQVLSFASGTALTDVAEAINTFTATTGLEARVSGTGIAVRSLDPGDDSFVSVRTIDSGGINLASEGAGVYQLEARNANAARRSTSSDDRSLFAAGVTTSDRGQNLALEIEGLTVTSVGPLAVLAEGSGIRAQIQLSLSGAQDGTSFSLFTLEAPADALPVIAPEQDDPAALLDRARSLVAHARNAWQATHDDQSRGEVTLAIEHVVRVGPTALEGPRALDLLRGR